MDSHLELNNENPQLNKPVGLVLEKKSGKKSIKKIMETASSTIRSQIK